MGAYLKIVAVNDTLWPDQSVKRQIAMGKMIAVYTI